MSSFLHMHSPSPAQDLLTLTAQEILAERMVSESRVAGQVAVGELFNLFHCLACKMDCISSVSFSKW